MGTLENKAAKNLTPKYFYEAAKLINCLCLPIRVQCDKDTFFTLQKDCICYSDVGVVLDTSVLKPNQTPSYFMTVYDLFITARNRHLHGGKLRIADGMAVSYFLTNDCLKFRKNHILLDISKLTPVDFDDLAENEKVWDWNL